MLLEQALCGHRHLLEGTNRHGLQTRRDPGGREVFRSKLLRTERSGELRRRTTVRPVGQECSTCRDGRQNESRYRLLE